MTRPQEGDRWNEAMPLETLGPRSDEDLALAALEWLAAAAPPAAEGRAAA
ncbi:hypothetical protein GCM10027601_22190 [Nocardioides ungokensis]